MGSRNHIKQYVEFIRSKELGTGVTFTTNVTLKIHINEILNVSITKYRCGDNNGDSLEILLSKIQK